MSDEGYEGVVVDAQEWQEWLAAVDAELRKEVGLVTLDLFMVPKVFYVGWLLSGFGPAEAAQAALDVAREG